MASSALRKGLAYFGLDPQPEVEAMEQIETVVPAPPLSVVEAPNVTPIWTASTYVQPAPAAPVPAPAVVSDLRRITTIHPRTYNDAQLIGEAFRNGTPVIMNLSDMSDDDRRRLVDFSSGLIFGLHGNIEPITRTVYLISPKHIQLLGEDEISAGEPISGQFYNQS
jgi:cell division inhibitor SepF